MRDRKLGGGPVRGGERLFLLFSPFLHGQGTRAARIEGLVEMGV